MDRTLFLPRATFALIAGASLTASALAAPPRLDIPPGKYELDPRHSSLTFRVKHMGLSNYTARFTRFGAAIDLDPARIENSKVTATVDPTSVETDYPGERDFDAEIARKPTFLDADRYPKAEFVSRSVRVRKDGTLEVTGDLAMRGATHPVTLNVKINAAKLHPFSKRPVLGISARGQLQRSLWGVTDSLPDIAADNVGLEIEGEFLRADDGKAASK
ncbi:MAG TPA: YceI family protein [Steroidobacteraceae bacterium]|nr:YceI family protein [Steroidobacteraceae bacterium]